MKQNQNLSTRKHPFASQFTADRKIKLFLGMTSPLAGEDAPSSYKMTSPLAGEDAPSSYKMTSPLAGEDARRAGEGDKTKKSLFNPLIGFECLRTQNHFPREGGSHTARGFTLIELLVVVLIIGILAAIAVPQYQVAVAKSKFTKLIPTVKALKDGMEMYYLTNGTYPPDAYPVDLGFSPEVASGCPGNQGTARFTCPNGIIFDRLDSNNQIVAGIDSNIKLAYIMWLDNSYHPGGIRCVANGEIANKVCKSLNGTVVQESFGTINASFSNYTVYKIN